MPKIRKRTSKRKPLKLKYDIQKKVKEHNKKIKKESKKLKANGIVKKSNTLKIINIYVYRNEKRPRYSKYIPL